MNAVNTGRLRDRTLTPKPRIVKGRFFGFFVERAICADHPAMRTQAQVFTALTFAEAIEKAHEWAGPKPQETK